MPTNAVALGHNQPYCIRTTDTLPIVLSSCGDGSCNEFIFVLSKLLKKHEPCITSYLLIHMYVSGDVE